MDDLPARIERAKTLLSTTKYAAMATVNADGTPHNTPFYLMHDPRLEYIYWGSHIDSHHSQNIVRTGQIFVVLYESQQRGGLYIRAVGGHPLEGDVLDVALAVHNDYRARDGHPPLDHGYYSAPNPLRMWSAKTMDFWVNGTERNLNGLVVRDMRQHIQRDDLIGK